jgi:hypothetical protein
MTQDVLLITAMAGAESCARVLAGQLQCEVEIADRASGLGRLRHGVFGVVVVEEALVECEPEWADALWAAAGPAIPLEMNFAITGCARLCREIRAALARRSGEQITARREVTAQLEEELKSSVTGLLLESELALREPQIPPALAVRVRRMVELAGLLRERLRSEPGRW